MRTLRDRSEPVAIRLKYLVQREDSAVRLAGVRDRRSFLVLRDPAFEAFWLEPHTRRTLRRRIDGGWECRVKTPDLGNYWRTFDETDPEWSVFDPTNTAKVTIRGDLDGIKYFGVEHRGGNAIELKPNTLLARTAERHGDLLALEHEGGFLVEWSDGRTERMSGEAFEDRKEAVLRDLRRPC